MIFCQDFSSINDSFNKIIEISKSKDKHNCIYFTIHNSNDYFINVKGKYIDLLYTVNHFIHIINNSEFYKKWNIYKNKYNNYPYISSFSIDICGYLLEVLITQATITLYVTVESNSMYSYISEIFTFSSIQRLLANELNLSIEKLIYCNKNPYISQPIKCKNIDKHIVFNWEDLTINNNTFKEFIQLKNNIIQVKDISKLLQLVDNLNSSTILKYTVLINMLYVLIHSQFKTLLHTKKVTVEHCERLFNSNIYKYCDKNIIDEYINF